MTSGLNFDSPLEAFDTSLQKWFKYVPRYTLRSPPVGEDTYWFVS